jgi:tRNA pseudouridine38-40 synthase
MTRTFLARLHYAGGGFLGWQRQATGRTVQGEVERVLERLAGTRIPAHAAGRTDAGVHAVGMGVSFTLPERWTPPELARAFNGLLPPDCWVESVHRMTAGFHARKSASARRYRYDIGTDPGAQSPFRRPYEWALGRELDLAVLERCAAMIGGTHDFSSFAVRGEPKPHYDCTVRVARWERREAAAGVRFTIEADRFLHHMVRMLVGTMVDAALGRRAEEDVTALLRARDNRETSPPAPPQGLYFVAADYPAECFASDLDPGA